MPFTTGLSSAGGGMLAFSSPLSSLPTLAGRILCLAHAVGVVVLMDILVVTPPFTPIVSFSLPPSTVFFTLTHCSRSGLVALLLWDFLFVCAHWRLLSLAKCAVTLNRVTVFVTQYELSFVTSQLSS